MDIRMDKELVVEIISAFDEAVRKAVTDTFEKGKPVSAIMHGWLVEIKPIKKVE